MRMLCSPAAGGSDGRRFVRRTAPSTASSSTACQLSPRQATSVMESCRSGWQSSQQPKRLTDSCSRSTLASVQARRSARATWNANSALGCRTSKALTGCIRVRLLEQLCAADIAPQCFADRGKVICSRGRAGQTWVQPSSVGAEPRWGSPSALATTNPRRCCRAHPGPNCHPPDRRPALNDRCQSLELRLRLPNYARPHN